MITIFIRKINNSCLAGVVDGEVVVTGENILGPAARKLVKAGVDPDTMLTTRWEGKDFDSFEPMKLSTAAKFSARVGYI